MLGWTAIDRGSARAGVRRSATLIARRDAAAALALLLSASVLAPAGAVSANEAGAPALLGPAGTRLPAVTLAGTEASIAIEVALPSGASATHVLLKPHSSNLLYQRDRNGFFVPWDRRPETLINTGFPVLEGRALFKVLEGAVGGLALPASVVLIAETPSGPAYGEFTIEWAP